MYKLFVRCLEDDYCSGSRNVSTNNSLSKDYPHLDDHAKQITAVHVNNYTSIVSYKFQISNSMLPYFAQILHIFSFPFFQCQGKDWFVWAPTLYHNKHWSCQIKLPCQELRKSGSANLCRKCHFFHLNHINPKDEHVDSFLVLCLV